MTGWGPRRSGGGGIGAEPDGSDGETTVSATSACGDGAAVCIDASNASRFQRNSRLGLMLWARATADTLTPIPDASATIARFCSALKCRRPTRTTYRPDLSPDISTEQSPDTTALGASERPQPLPARRASPEAYVVGPARAVAPADRAIALGQFSRLAVDFQSD